MLIREIETIPEIKELKNLLVITTVEVKPDGTIKLHSQVRILTAKEEIPQSPPNGMILDVVAAMKEEGRTLYITVPE